jgi:uncharacterized RmlC-like cupin family protein
MAREPVVVDPTELATVEGAHGHQFAPVITAPVCRTEGVSSGQLWIPNDGHGGNLCVHRADVIVLNLRGESVLLWYDRDGSPHELPYCAGQHLHIPAGVPHGLYTRSAEPVVAALFHAGGRFDEGVCATVTGLTVDRASRRIVLGAEFREPECG